MPRMTTGLSKKFWFNNKKIFAIALIGQCFNVAWAADTIWIYGDTWFRLAQNTNPQYWSYFPYVLTTENQFYHDETAYSPGGVGYSVGGHYQVHIGRNANHSSPFNDGKYYATHIPGIVETSNSTSIPIVIDSGDPNIPAMQAPYGLPNDFSININSGDILLTSNATQGVINLSNVGDRVTVTITNNGTIFSGMYTTAVQCQNAQCHLVINQNKVIWGHIIGSNYANDIYLNSGSTTLGDIIGGGGTNNLYLYSNFSTNYSTSNFNIHPTDNFTITGGTTSGGNIINANNLNIQGGTFSTPITNNSGKNISVTGGTVDSSISNSGTITINGGTVNGGNTITNYNQLNIQSGTVSETIANNSGGTLSITGGTFSSNTANSGTMTISGATVNGGSTINNYNQLNIQGGTVSETIANNSGGTLSITGGTVTSTIGNSGTMTVSGATLSGSNTLTNSNILNIQSGTVTMPITNNAGTITISGGTLSGTNRITNSARLDIANATVSMPITNNASGSVNVNAAGIITTTTGLINNGTVTVNTDGTISGTGTFANSGLLTMDGGIMSLPIKNNVSGTVAVGNGSTISGSTALENKGTLQLNPGGTISVDINFGSTGGVINMAGGYITGKITGHNLNSDIINILADGTSGQMLSQVENVGNLFINTNNFTINTAMKGMNHNFATGYNTTTTIGGGGDVSGNGAISNAGTLAVAGGTIGSDSAMGNVINAGTINVAGDVRVRTFTNGVSQPLGMGVLTSVETLNIIINNNGQPGGGGGGSGAVFSGISGPTIISSPPISVNKIYINGDTTPAGTPFNIAGLSIADPNPGLLPGSSTGQDTVMLFAKNGTINFSSVSSSITPIGRATSNVILTGTPTQINQWLSALQFTHNLSTTYGLANITVVVNDNNPQGTDNPGSISGDSVGSANAGALNITSGNMVTRAVTNTLGNITISGGDLSPLVAEYYDMLNSAAGTTPNNTNVIKVSGSGTVGKNTKFRTITNKGQLILEGSSATINANNIQLTKEASYNNSTSGTMTTSGTVNAPINFTADEVLNIGGGIINNTITGASTAASTINITGPFITTNNITNVNNISVTNDTKGIGNFTVNNRILNVNTGFSTAAGTTVTVNADKGGSVFGTGFITNNGTMTLTTSASSAASSSSASTVSVNNADVLGTNATPMGLYTNTGAVNINTGISYFSGLTNNNDNAIVNIAGGSLRVGSTGGVVNNTKGTIQISKGDLSGITDAVATLNNSALQTITVSGTGIIGASGHRFSVVNNSGIINVQTDGKINAPISNSGVLNLAVDDVNVGNITNNVAGTLNVNSGGILNNSHLSVSGTINLNSGGKINTPISFGANGGVLNLSGGSLNSSVSGSGSLGTGTGTVNVNADFTYDGVYDPISNIANFNVASGTLNLNGLITSVNQAASVSKGASMIINNGGNIVGGPNFTNLTNSGTITLKAGGTISTPIIFGPSEGILNLSGGFLNVAIGDDSNIAACKGTINLTASTMYNDYDQHISNIDTFNANGSSFNVNAPITRINTAFNVSQNSVVTINPNGYISGNGVINNAGTITLAGGTIGSGNGSIATNSIGSIVNGGNIYVNNNVYVSGNITNNNNASVVSNANNGAGIFPTLTASSSSGSTATPNVGTIIVNSEGNIFGNAQGTSVLKNYGVVTLNSGGCINIPINFGTVDTGILNLSGGSINNTISGGDGFTTSAGTINVNANFSYTATNGHTISHVNNINVNNASNFIINDSINGINNAFTTASGTNTLIQHIATSTGTSTAITGNGLITNAGSIQLYNGSIGSGTQSFSSLTNTGTIEVGKSTTLGGNIYVTTLNNDSGGTLTVNRNGSISSTLINHSGIMTTSGTINAPIAFGANVTQLNIFGGSITGNITGYISSDSMINNANVININGDFTTGGIINNVGSIKVNSGNFHINNAVDHLTNNFSTLYSTTTTINAAGSINGTGIINNVGSITLAGGTIGTVSSPFNNIYNIGIFSVNSGNLIVATVMNGALASGTSDPTANLADPFTAYGSINITVDPLALDINLNQTAITNAIPGSQVTPENTSLIFSAAKNNSITIDGIDDNGGTIQLTAAHGRLKASNVSGLSSIAGNNTNTITMTGPLVDLNNALQGLIFIPDANYVGSEANIQIYLHNTQVASSSASSVSTTAPIPPASYTPVFNVNGGTVNLGDFTNKAVGAVLNVSNGTVTANSITNTLGAINISGGDLSGIAVNTNTLNNAAGQIITISGTGTIGAHNQLGAVTNSGIINAAGGNITVGTFTNNHVGAVLNVSNGIVKTDNITNSLGTINISGGDLSSVSSVAANASTLSNAAGQTITVSNTGTIGATQALGAVTNSGIINAAGGNITVGTFTNNHVGAVLNVSNGIVKTDNITNSLGTINISGGDLSSVSSVAANASTLSNAAGQTIIVSNTGTIGATQALGAVTNSGIINAAGGNIKVGTFTNNYADAILNVSTGIVKTGNIINTLGTINILGGDLSSVSSVAANASTLSNAVGQTITVSGTGTIGITQALGAVTNNGVFNASGGNINVGAVSNNGLFNINTLGSNKLSAIGNFMNNIHGITYVSKSFDIGSGNIFTNNGTVNMLKPATLDHGNYTVTGTGTHITTIDLTNIPATLTLLNGTATLQQGSTIDIQYSGDVLVPDNHHYTIITGTSASLGININLLGSTDLVYYTVDQSVNNIEVVSHRHPIVSIVDAVGNYTATPAATVLDDLINVGTVTGDLRTALSRLDGLSSDQEVSDAVNQLLPDTNITSEVGFIAPTMIFGTIAERAELIARAGINNIQTGYAAGGMQANNSFWIKGFGGSIKQKQKITTAGYNANTAGVSFGVDEQFFENTWIGLGFSTVNTHINSKDSSAKKTTVVSQQATLYASYSPENYYIDSFIAMLFNSYKSQRNIVYNGLNYTSHAAYNSIQPAAKVSAGYIYNVTDAFRIIPNMSLQYSLLRQSTYDEVGAGNLSLERVKNPLLTQLEGGIGVKLALLHDDEEQTYNPDIHFMVLHDFKSAAQTTTAQFLGGGDLFSVTSATPNKTTYNVGAGFTFVHQDRFNCTLHYDLKKKNKYIGHAGSLAVRYAF